MYERPAAGKLNLMRYLTRLGPLLVGLCVLGLAGCGGGSVPKSLPVTKAKTPTGTASTPTRPPITPQKIQPKPSLVTPADSAGSYAGYTPTGTIVADNGFRPNVDGFAFENYGNDAGPVNLEPAQMEELFGPRVCSVGSGTSCKLTPSAKAWMQQENLAMADGHCMGFSVTALRFFSHNLSPATFGASEPIKLPIVGNDPLQQEIAEDWAYQSLPSVHRAAIIGTPDHVLGALITALKSRKETYTLAIFKPNGTGGHAITPFAVEKRTGGRYEILVYDNNFPGVVRKVDVDTIRDRWHYVGGINPSDTSEIYDGDARTESMGLFPTTPGETTQPCPFCSTNRDSDKGPGTAVPSKNSFVEVSVQSNQAQHPHLLFIDPATGRETGFDHGQLVQQIPGIIVNTNYAVRNWTSAAEPTYDIPLGHPLYEVLVDGTPLKRQTVVKLSVNGDGVLFTVTGVNMEPGQQDRMLLPANNLEVDYASNSPFHFTPLITAEFVSNDRDPHHPRFVLAASSLLGYKTGTGFGLFVNPSSRTVVVRSDGTTAPVRPNASAAVLFQSLPLNGGDQGRQYKSFNVRFDPNTEAAAFSYLDPQGPILTVGILNRASSRVTRTVGVPAVPVTH